MSRTSASQQQNDFKEVTYFFQKRGIIPEPCPNEIIRFAKSTHKAVYSLVFWRFRLRRIPIHGSVFLDELASDALQVLPQSLMGYNKAANLLIRGVIENALRHIYFSDHPVEFARLNNTKKWYVSIEDLFEYLHNHPLFIETRQSFDAPANLKSCYSELSEYVHVSEYVHGRTVGHLQLKKAFEHLVFDYECSERVSALLSRSAESVNFLMAVFHSEQVSKLPSDDRAIYLQTLNSTARRALKGI